METKWIRACKKKRKGKRKKFCKNDARWRYHLVNQKTQTQMLFIGAKFIFPVLDPKAVKEKNSTRYLNQYGFYKFS